MEVTSPLRVLLNSSSVFRMLILTLLGIKYASWKRSRSLRNYKNNKVYCELRLNTLQSITSPETIIISRNCHRLVKISFIINNINDSKTTPLVTWMVHLGFLSYLHLQVSLKTCPISFHPVIFFWDTPSLSIYTKGIIMIIKRSLKRRRLGTQV